MSFLERVGLKKPENSVESEAREALRKEIVEFLEGAGKEIAETAGGKKEFYRDWLRQVRKFQEGQKDALGGMHRGTLTTDLEEQLADPNTEESVRTMATLLQRALALYTKEIT
jgi:hypothetical protein